MGPRLRDSLEGPTGLTMSYLRLRCITARRCGARPAKGQAHGAKRRGAGAGFQNLLVGVTLDTLNSPAMCCKVLSTRAAC